MAEVALEGVLVLGKCRPAGRTEHDPCETVHWSWLKPQPKITTQRNKSADARKPATSNIGVKLCFHIVYVVTCQTNYGDANDTRTHSQAHT